MVKVLYQELRALGFRRSIFTLYRFFADTGSSVRTKESAASLGAKVVDFPWADNFATARNVALEHATGDYAFWLDAEDRLTPHAQKKLQAFFSELRPCELIGYLMKCAYLINSKNKTGTLTSQVRLFPLRTEIRWSYRVHEQILPSLRKAGGDVRLSDVVIENAGSADPALRRRTLEHDLRLLEMENQEHPDDPCILFNLGSVYLEMNNPIAALPCLKHSLELSAITDSFNRTLYVLIASAQRALGYYEDALQTCFRGRQSYPMDTELAFHEAALRQDTQDFQGAAEILQQLLREKEPEHFDSVAADLRGVKARDLLAQVYLNLKQFDKAHEQYELIIKEDPNALEAYEGFAELWLAQKRWDKFQAAMTDLKQRTTDDQVIQLLQARRLLFQRRFSESRAFAVSMIEKYPEAITWRVLLSYVYLQEGKDRKAAEEAVRDILALAPGHPGARHNLEVLLRQKAAQFYFPLFDPPNRL